MIATAQLEEARQVDLLGMKFDALSSGDVVQRVMDGIRGGTGGWSMAPNLDHLRRLVRDPQARHYFSGPDLVVADGQPLVWASYLQGTPLPGRVAGSDLISSVSTAAADEDCRVFFVGGAGQSSSGAATTLTERYPGLQVVGTHCPPMGFDTDATAVQDAINCVVAATPDIVFVGLPFPKANALILRLKLRLPRTWLFGLGVSFSFMRGGCQTRPHLDAEIRVRVGLASISGTTKAVSAIPSGRHPVCASRCSSAACCVGCEGGPKGVGI